MRYEKKELGEDVPLTMLLEVRVYVGLALIAADQLRRGDFDELGHLLMIGGPPAFHCCVLEYEFNN